MRQYYFIYKNLRIQDFVLFNQFFLRQPKYLGYWKNTNTIQILIPWILEEYKYNTNTNTLDIGRIQHLCLLASLAAKNADWLLLCRFALFFWFIYFSFNFLLALFHPFLGISFYRGDVWPAKLLWKGTFWTEGETRKTFMDWNLNANILVLTLIHNIFRWDCANEANCREKEIDFTYWSRYFTYLLLLPMLERCQQIQQAAKTFSERLMAHKS